MTAERQGAEEPTKRTLHCSHLNLLAAKLKAAGANVVMTRETDTYVPLRKRVAISHQADADAFISIHYDANPDSSCHRFTTYYTHSQQKELAATSQ